MREYEEGILLFEITRQAVWDKASADTIGLKKYFDAHKSNYNWNERALIHEYTVKSTDEALIQSIYTFSKKNPVDKVLNKFNKKTTGLVTFEKDVLEKEAENMKSLSWTAGIYYSF
jgi:peptidyl-prolyl cis-trans isomerase SurA